MDSPAAFPLVELHPIADTRNRWVGAWTRVGPFDGPALQAVFGDPDVFAALAPLDIVLRVPRLAALTPAVFTLLPKDRVVLAIAAAELAHTDGALKLAELEQQGLRVLVDVSQLGVDPNEHRLYGQACNCRDGVPAAPSLVPLAGPHFAYNVSDQAAARRCAELGFVWLAGDYPCHPLPTRKRDDGTRRKRLLGLLTLLARDATDRELEQQIRQDPALSYQLLRAANSAAVAPRSRVVSFQHALALLGRRQLERWLQVLLYARPGEEGEPNLLLPLAARRAAQMESLCKQRGRGQAMQDRGFMVGIFSLLEPLLGISMAEIVGSLPLPYDVDDALLQRRGELGELLALVCEAAPAPARLAACGVDARAWWQSQLHAYHWAIQVARDL